MGIVCRIHQIRVGGSLVPVSVMPLEGHHQRKLIKIVMTEGYGVRATTIEGQNAFASMLCFR